MRTIFAFLLCVVIFSCTKQQSHEVDALDGFYIDSGKSSYLIISEYEEGKLGYYVYDLSKGISEFTYSYSLGSISITQQNKDSVITFTERSKKIKERSVLPIKDGLKAKVKNSPDVLCLKMQDGEVVCFGRMKKTRNMTEIKDATRLSLKAWLTK